MATEPAAIGGGIDSQPINDWHSYFKSEKVGKDWMPFVNVKDYGAIGNGVADDTQAIKQALASGAKFIIVPEGTYKITESLSITSGMHFVGIGRSSEIIQHTDNIPLMFTSGERVYIADLYLAFANKQPLANVWGNIIHIQRLYESVIERLYLDGGHNGVYCEHYYTDGTTTEPNYIYSCSIRDFRITNYSDHAMYLASENAGNTGCLFDNIYAVNWNDFNAGTKNSATAGFYFKNFSEFSARQLNCEHTKNNSAIVVNSCNNADIESIHVEGFESTLKYKSIIEVDNSKVNLSSLTISDSDFSTVTYFSLFNLLTGGMLSAKNVKTVDNIASTTGNYLFYGNTSSAGGYIDATGIDPDVFANWYFPQDDIVRRYNLNYYTFKFPSSATRPSSPGIGQSMFDTSIGKPIWYDGTNWIDATGATV